ncbi:homeobox protein cut-like 1 isoform X1 [Saccostrea echinata]|uniref:homeobox protein cut-like 1 isoform X1 n=1 Tax=Saccostrea echinata TaxID=191078 RepID=UPI002A81F8A6|nr:homeobox protein cut-like 1 isoform X1 [Saccostrea echinata]
MAASTQSVCQFWKDFDLQHLQKELDITATELANRQDESDLSRKRLVEQSREFKKNTPEDIRKLVAPLLKSFQSEVDSLSKRSKAAEAAFLSIYKRIIDLPDPVPVLEYALQIQKKAHRVSDLEIENKQLRDTLEEYNHEFAEVKNQEVTIKQLRDRLKECEDKIEATAEARSKEKERELQRVFTEKERQLQETQLSVAKKLGEAEQKVASLQSALENVQSELFEVKAKYEEATTAKSDEMEMVMSDLERANERAEASEREIEQIRTRLTEVTQKQKLGETNQEAPDMDRAIDMFKRSGLEHELASKEKEISQLVEDVQRLQGSLNKLREATTSQVSKLEDELASKNQAFKLLEEKIKSQEDYEEIKRELSVMKSIEFSNNKLGSDEPDGDIQPKSLEVLLLEKNKALQSENTVLKVNNSDLSGTTTPALSENAAAFASMLGEEIASSYQRQNSSRISTPSSPPTPSSNGIKEESVPEKINPKRPISLERMPSVSGESTPSLPPPPSPQFFSYLNGHGLPNYMSMSMGKTDPSNSQGIDTSLVAKTVRELLSIHNIGQRLFAKHVLGLSQGTVSELLSKPKSWDKLTEKGRESYRKMYAWATDERNIMALKAISPKKASRSALGLRSVFNPMFPLTGPTTLVPSVQREDSQTEERITQILNEAQQAMQFKKAMEQQQVAHAMVNSYYQQEMTRLAQVTAQHGLPSPHGSASSIMTSSGSIALPHPKDLEQHRRRESVESQGSAKEMVERIYRQELLKLAQAAESAGNIAAVTMYQQELARLAQNAQKGDAEPGEIRRSRGSPGEHQEVSIKLEPCDVSADDAHGPIDLSKNSTSSAPTTPTSNSSIKSPSESSHRPGSAFMPFRQKMNGHESNLENHVPFGQQSECISPLQRMQNIANSLMSRPHLVSSAKPLKAVLPPITQDQFDKYSNMNTDDLVKQVKETLSQYSISQRLFGESVLGLSQGSVSDLLARPKPWHMLTQKGREPFIRMQIFLEDTEAIPKLVASQYHIPPDKLMRGRNQQEMVSPSSDKLPSSNHGNRPPVSSSTRLAPESIPNSPLPSHHQLPPPFHPVHHTPTHHFSHPPYSWAPFSYPSSMLEVVAMTSEIDTLELTSRVKDVLQFHNLGQKLFGEAVLGLSQGSVSELLSKPKPWHMLSIKGREPFIKMHLWLSDPHNVDRLKHYQNEVKAQRRRRGSLEDRSYDSPSMPKRPRVFFTEEQKDKLRMAYNHDPYPNQNTIEALASELNVGVKTVINWFHNHRMRAKQQQHVGSGSQSSPVEYSNTVKSENNEDISDQSDASSMSGETNPFLSNFPANSENSQWLFPQFEPMSMQKANFKSIKMEIDNEDDGVGDDDDSRSMSSNSSHQSNESSKNNAKEKKTEELREEKGGPVFKEEEENSGGEQIEDPLQRENKMSGISQSGVNKRKRSNPQYVSEGRQLDKTKHVFEGLPSQVSRDEGVDLELDEDVEKENESGNVEIGVKAPVFDRLNKMDKKSVDFPEGDWETERNSNIEKIQKNLHQSPATGDWEF